MDNSGPSSVTVEEAVAKMIGFDRLPDRTHLEEGLDYLINVTQQDYFRTQQEYFNAHNDNFSNAKEGDPEASIIRRYGDELQDWLRQRLLATTLLEDIQKCIDNEDPLLHTILSDTCRTRLTTQSVYAWAKKRHNILIPDWKEFRGSAQKPYQKVDKVLLEGQHLFEAIVLLVDELLCRDWPAWRGNTPDLAPPKRHVYFLKTRPNINAISSAISEKITEDKKPRKGRKNEEDADNNRTITTHINRSIKNLTSDNQEKRLFTKRQFPAAYRTLIGLYRLLDKNFKPLPPSTVRDLKETELQIFRFTKSLSSASKRIRDDELNDCLMRAVRNADEEDL